MKKPILAEILNKTLLDEYKARDNYQKLIETFNPVRPSINILDSKNILSCMNDAIPNAMIAAVRPRSIAVNKMSNKFVVNFMEAPMEAPTNTMVEWVSSIKNA